MKNRSLLVIFADRLQLRVHEAPSDGPIRIDGEVFTDSGLGKSIGFYDWLRGRDKRILGVRTTYSQDSKIEGFAEVIGKSKAIEWDRNQFLIYFSQEKRFEESLSDDQDFGIHRLMVSPDGVAMLTYDLAQLPKDDLSQLEAMAQSTMR